MVAGLISDFLLEIIPLLISSVFQDEGDVVEEWEKSMWEYFVGLYKNCNKGIKGRGKDRRISNTSLVPAYDGSTFERRDSLVSTDAYSRSPSMGMAPPGQGMLLPRPSM